MKKQFLGVGLTFTLLLASCEEMDTTLASSQQIKYNLNSSRYDDMTAFGAVVFEKPAIPGEKIVSQQSFALPKELENACVKNCISGQATKVIVDTKSVPIGTKQTFVTSPLYKSNPIGPQVLRLSANFGVTVELTGKIKIVKAGAVGSFFVNGGIEGTYTLYACLWQQDEVRSRYITYQKYVLYKGDLAWTKSGAPFDVQQPAAFGDAVTKVKSGFVCGVSSK